jgi:hypothetical protein
MRLEDLKKGDHVHIDRRSTDGRRYCPRVGQVISINKRRQTVLCHYRKYVFGDIQECKDYFKPEEIVGVYI